MHGDCVSHNYEPCLRYFSYMYNFDNKEGDRKHIKSDKHQFWLKNISVSRIFVTDCENLGLRQPLIPSLTNIPIEY